LAERSDLAAWLRLTLTPGLGGEGQRRLLETFGLPQAVFAASRPSLAECLGPKLADTLLAARGVTDYEEIRVNEEPRERIAMMQLTGRRTVPQIFIGETHVGGCDDLIALDRRGELTALLGAD